MVACRVAITDGITQQNVQRNPSGTLPRHDPVNGYAATCRMHGLDLFAYLAEVCTASMADLAVPQLLPATA